MDNLTEQHARYERWFTLCIPIVFLMAGPITLPFTADIHFGFGAGKMESPLGSNAVTAWVSWSDIVISSVQGR